MVDEDTPLISTASQLSKSNRPVSSFTRAKNKRGSKTGAPSPSRVSVLKSKRQSFKVSKKPQPVLNSLFRSESTLLPHEGNVKSWLYTLLNPKSRQLTAICFKYFIASVILVDFVIYVISTEPAYQHENRPAIFDTMEKVTSSIFLLEYVARLFTITENRKYRHWFYGRLRYLVSIPALVDLFATMPFFVERFTGRDLPTLTYLRTFRLARILKTNGFMKAADAVRRVLYYNRQIMSLSVFVGLYMVLFTGILMYHLRPRDHNSDGKSTCVLFLLLLHATLGI
jgi:hypothetical protein